MKTSCIVKLLLLGGAVYLVAKHFAKPKRIPGSTPIVDSEFDDFTEIETIRMNGIPSIKNINSFNRLPRKSGNIIA